MGNAGQSASGVCGANKTIAQVNCFANNDFGSLPYNHCMSEADKAHAECVQRAQGNSSNSSNSGSGGKSPYVDTDRCAGGGRRCRG